jgi:uncharacterized membrane protein SirB2
MTFYWIKQLHIATVVFNLGFFLLRYLWMLAQSPLATRRWPRILSQVNDSLLLGAGIALAWMLHQYPFGVPWLTAKLLALLAYILFGTLALRRGRSLRIRAVSGLLALASAGYLRAVALTRSPLPFG